MFGKIVTLFFCFWNFILFAQQSKISGIIISSDTQLPLPNVTVQIKNTMFFGKFNSVGEFVISGNFPLGEQIISINCIGYSQQQLPVIVEAEKAINIGVVELYLDVKEKQQYFAIIDLSSDQEQLEDETSENQILLQANRDAFLSSVAFNWSSSFFKVRGLGSEYSKVLVNGIEMNSFYNQRPNWSAWSGLNDLYRSQEYTPYSKANPNTFGGLTGVNQLQFYADVFKKGSKLSLASTNRTYQGRVMATHNSGALSNGWSYSLSISGAAAAEGYLNGTSLRAYSFSGNVSKVLNANHKINITTIYTPSQKGKASPNTQEVIDLKGRQYNSYWGLLNGEIKNARIKSVSHPIFTLNHFWKLSNKITIQNNVLYQKGSLKNSRLEFNGRQLLNVPNSDIPIFIGGSRNPDPAYYQRLPSFFLQEEGNEDFESAFRSEKTFQNNGQLDWEEIFRRNKDAKAGAYAFYEDVVEDRFLGINSIWSYTHSPSFNIEGKIGIRRLLSENYAKINDLLGAKGYLDIDGFSEGAKAQNNLQTPNRIVGVGDRFRYNYEIEALDFNGFIQTNISIPKWEMYFALSAKRINYQRNGLFENGNYPENASLGKSKSLDFIGLGLKFGFTYKLSNKYYLSSNLNLVSNPPTIQQSFSNPRQNNALVINLKNQKWTNADISLNYQYGKILTRLSGYYIKRDNLTEVSFFFTENIATLGRTDSSAFIQEITTGISTVNQGLEFGAEIAATNTITINASCAYGKHYYNNNPNLYITSDSFSEPLFLGESKLKNYRLANGPQQSYGLGFSYRDPSYWWVNTQLNYLSNSFIDISPFSRTQNFTTDIDGQPLTDFNEERARELLKQEEFEGYFLLNAIGGKSWRIKNNTYLGFTFGVQNILGQLFKTGGFEQSRNSNFRSLNEDQSRSTPLFGNRYWLGNGTTYYLNTYWRF